MGGAPAGRAWACARALARPVWTYARRVRGCARTCAGWACVDVCTSSPRMCVGARRGGPGSAVCGVNRTVRHVGGKVGPAPPHRLSARCVRSGALTAAREKRESVESRGGRDGARGTGLSRSTATGAPCTAATLTSVAAPKLPKSARGPTPYLYRRPPRYTVRTSCKNIIHFTCMATRCRRYESTLSRRALARGPRRPRAALAGTPSASPRLVTDVELRFHTPRQSVLSLTRPAGRAVSSAAVPLHDLACLR